MAKVNKHLDHAEDLMLLEGRRGAERAINVLKQVGYVLDPTGGPGIQITTKWDGAPAVICGIDPSDGKFFVGTKGVFAQTPKLAKTQAEVQLLYSGGLLPKMSAALRYLKPVVTRGILQGDLLFTDDKSTTRIKDQTLTTFRPNTITYAVDPSTEIGRKINTASLGIVFHTKYEGESLQTLSSSFNVSPRDYNQTAQVWATNATFQNVGGVASFSADEYIQYKAAVNMAEGSVKKAGDIFDKIQSGKRALALDTIFIQYFNKYYRAGTNVPGVAAAYNAFLRYLGGQYNTAIQKNRTLKAQADKAFKFVEAIDFIQENSQKFQMLIAAYLNITKAKLIAVQKMNQVASLKTFVETGNGDYKVTAPEGFVAISGGQAVKLIDRLEFSNLNFNVPKAW